MAQKQYFLVIDSETSITDKVVDFGAVIVDRNGRIFKQCAVMVAGIFGVDNLFHDKSAGIWSAANLQKRTEHYNSMLNSGSRMLASVNAINRWLEKAAGEFKPTLTAYNLAFDAGKCRNTGIDLNMFPERFCLWHTAANSICKSRKFRDFIMANHLFNNRTDLGNMTYKTDAETVASYLHGQILVEPHTAIEDIIEFEIPILVSILKKRNWRELVKAYNWKEFQVRDHFKAN